MDLESGRRSFSWRRSDRRYGAYFVAPNFIVETIHTLEIPSIDSYAIPLFEIFGRSIFRVARNVSIGPFYGIRDGLLGGGVRVRVHFLD